ncbi:MAG: nucleotidyltransferase domain-containing protein [Nitrospirae bacterium]|nr:nucleotidyltransferase domain-containing protein [Nitrospirota bacterium]
MGEHYTPPYPPSRVLQRKKQRPHFPLKGVVTSLDTRTQKGYKRTQYVQRELGRLAEAGIINRSARDRVVEYRANRKCPIFAELEGLIRKTAGLAGVLREALGPLSREIDLAFVYGSHAAGTAGAASDVDVLIVGEADELAIHRALVKAELRLSRPVNYVLFSRKELQNRRKEKGGFLARVLSGPKIPIVEDSRDV